MFYRRIFRWDRSAGQYKVDLDPGLRQSLREMMEHLLGFLEDPGAPELHRLFPPAYSAPQDIMAQDEYRRLMQDDLVQRRRDECQVILDTVDAAWLTEDQLMAWTRSINSLRLILGTYLDVQQDDDSRERSTEGSIYEWLSFLLDETVTAMSRQT